MSVENPQTYEDYLENLKNEPLATLQVHIDNRAGGAAKRAAITILENRRKTEEEEKFQKYKSVQEAKQKREEEHTLIVYFRLATWSERFGMIMTFVGIFFFGYLCAKMNFASRLIDLIRDVIP